MIEDVYPLSPLQEGLYYHWLTGGDSTAYFMQTSHLFKGSPDIGLLEKSFCMLAARHAILRTFFTREIGDTLLQVVKQDIKPVFLFKDVAGEPGFSLAEYKAADRERGFDLHRGSQMRLSVLGMGGDTHVFIWSHHHILMDGWCVSILAREFFRIYLGLVTGRLPELSVAYPYSSYISWLGRIDHAQALQYWKNYLAGYDTVCSFPQKVMRDGPGQRTQEIDFRIGGGVRQAIRALCSALSVTESVFLHLAWGILLGLYNDADDVVYGSVVSGRPADMEGIEEMVGLFINTIPVRVRMEKEVTIQELLKQTQRKHIEGLDYHYTQLAQVVAESRAGEVLFDHILQIQNVPAGEVIGEGSSAAGGQVMDISGLESSGDNTYDLTCIMIPCEDHIGVAFKYNSLVYEREQLLRMRELLMQIVSEMTVKSSMGALEYTSAAEKQLVLTEFNRMHGAEPSGKPVIALFGEWVQRTPDAIAVRCGHREVSYSQLEDQSNRLAHYLTTVTGCRAGDLAGILLDRSEEMLTAILAVLKCGAAYVPIDPDLPALKKEYILKDTDVKVLLTDSAYLLELGYYQGNIFAMDVQLPMLGPAGGLEPAIVGTSDAAYVIYTSGSTGLPKGCVIDHGNLSNYIEWANGYYFEGCEKPHFGLFTSLSFDLTVTSVFCPLTRGGTLTVFDQRAQLDEMLETYFRRGSGFDCIKLTPSHLNLIRHLDLSGTDLRCAVVGGEEVLPEHVGVLKVLNPEMRIYNEYGPTETTVGCIVKELTLHEPVVIGKPIACTGIYILNRDRALMPVGISGEIHIGGRSVSQGYLNRPELTAERFIAHPFGEPGRIYRTGDLARWLPDGNVQLIGRKDDQVKIRGYRIEPAEIEQAIYGYPQIEAAVVLVKTGVAGDKELVAYVVGKAGLNAADLNGYLWKHLPAYMIPGHYVQLDEMPLTNNGKVDKKKLPEPDGARMPSGVCYAAPRTAIEEKLVDIWQQLLGRERVGIHDNFFTLGGHSLKVIQLISRINNVFLVQLNIQYIFKEPTIEGIGEHIAFILGQNQHQHNGLLMQIDI